MLHPPPSRHCCGVRNVPWWEVLCHPWLALSPGAAQGVQEVLGGWKAECEGCVVCSEGHGAGGIWGAKGVQGPVHSGCGMYGKNWGQGGCRGAQQLTLSPGAPLQLPVGDGGVGSPSALACGHLA